MWKKNIERFHNIPLHEWNQIQYVLSRNFSAGCTVYSLYRMAPSKWIQFVTIIWFIKIRFGEKANLCDCILKGAHLHRHCSSYATFLCCKESKSVAFIITSESRFIRGELSAFLFAFFSRWWSKCHRNVRLFPSIAATVEVSRMRTMQTWCCCENNVSRKCTPFMLNFFVRNERKELTFYC